MNDAVSKSIDSVITEATSALMLNIAEPTEINMIRNLVTNATSDVTGRMATALKRNMISLLDKISTLDVATLLKLKTPHFRELNNALNDLEHTVKLTVLSPVHVDEKEWFMNCMHLATYLTKEISKVPESFRPMLESKVGELVDLSRICDIVKAADIRTAILKMTEYSDEWDRFTLIRLNNLYKYRLNEKSKISVECIEKDTKSIIDLAVDVHKPTDPHRHI